MISLENEQTNRPKKEKHEIIEFIKQERWCERNQMILTHQTKSSTLSVFILTRRLSPYNYNKWIVWADQTQIGRETECETRKNKNCNGECKKAENRMKNQI